MRKVVRKSIRRKADGIDLAAEINAVIAVNTGRDATSSRTEAHSHHTVVQGDAGKRDQPDESSDEQTPGPLEKEQP